MCAFITAPSPVVVISYLDALRFGCPHCGSFLSYVSLEHGDTEIRNCGNPACLASYHVVRHEKTHSDFADDGNYPVVVKHPAHAEIIAISKSDARRYGCPHCGNYRSYASISTETTEVRNCQNNACLGSYHVVRDGTTHSDIPVYGVRLLVRRRFVDRLARAV